MDQRTTYLDDAGEDGLEALVCLPLLLALLHVLCELVEQVIDDLGSKDLNAVIVSEVLRFGHHFNIKGQETGILFVSSFIRSGRALHRLQHILFVDRSDIDCANRDIALVEELEQGLERADCRRLNADTFLSLIDILFKNVDHVALDLIDGILHLLFGVALEQLGTGDGCFETRS